MAISKHVVSRASARELDDLTPTGEWDASEPTPSDPHTPVEMRFLLRLRDNPDDFAMRMVYSDWLEERGESRKAEFLRLVADLPLAPTPADIKRMRIAGQGLERDWRAIVSRAPIEKCHVHFEFRCPKAWEALESTDDASVRHCNTCKRDVFFCTNLDEVRQRGRENQCVAFCATLDRKQALDDYEGDKVEIMMGEIGLDDDTVSE